MSETDNLDLVDDEPILLQPHAHPQVRQVLEQASQAMALQCLAAESDTVVSSRALIQSHDRLTAWVAIPLVSPS
jgi:hypothetical protein